MFLLITRLIVPIRCCCGKQILSVPDSTVRAEINASHIYTHSTGDCCTSTRKRHQNICIHRRPATSRGFCKQDPSTHRHNNRPHHQFGVSDKLLEVSIDPNTASRIPRRKTRPPTPTRATSPTRDTQSKTSGIFHSQQAKDNSPTLVTIPGTSLKSYRYRPQSADREWE